MRFDGYRDSFFLLFLAITSSGCGGDDAPARPTTDSEIQSGLPSRFPQVGLVNMQGGGACTGTLIAPDVVLTAAHCLGSPIEGFYLGFGEPVPFTESDARRIPEDMVRVEVDGVLPHPHYNWDPMQCPNDADIGLLHLANPIDPAIVQAVQLQRRADLEGIHGLAIGYGLHEGPSGLTFKEQRAGRVAFTQWTDKALEADVAQANGSSPPWAVDGRSGWAGYTDKGDSGGPVFAAPGLAVLAVTSCGDIGASRGWYTLVEPYEPWIRANIEHFGR